MTTKSFALTATAVLTLAIPSMADARTQMRAVGSSTVYPFSKAVAERVARANPRLGTPIIESTGTGAGMKLFCAGVGARFPDVVNASRRMKASEAKLCASNGVSRVTEVQVGLDGIAIATARATPLANLTQREIYLAIAKTPFGKPNRARTWKDVNGRLPAIPIRVMGPPSTSGTRDALGELIMTPPCEANAGMAAMKKANEAKFKAICTAVRTDGGYIEAGENDNLIVQKLAANPGSVGVFGYSFLEENASKVKGIAINGVQPSYATISSFRYPGARPLYVYVKNAHAAAIPMVRAFVAEFTKESAMGPRGYLLSMGMVAAPTHVRARSQQAARNLAPLNLAALK
ncbi:MAG: Phosphate ABC transporter, periplasmic phosphate-binding protein PstS [uncultured Sphingomonas sp.]|uniref:Phosphate ABC transporter, periplasmic phosphate-binding protein PstS n=1 Tax=uncultured Sphingomonas sp. TaxID=158754 RepID=A0A6J4SDA1_9SPHN|nr:substrate-binding domain-containing protein [uncultured Sphingomonas sp.]CAA9495301.1 MAG: Phosphate ABC transporter, periplasmic phosphate-binding protein PstS [uncultured Sphingomonas sp.]